MFGQQIHFKTFIFNAKIKCFEKTPHISIVRDNHEQATVHAEQNAIADCAKRGVSCKGSTAYITHYPCIICTRLLLAAGIESIKYLHDYKNDPLVVVFTNQLNVDVEKMPI